MMIIVPLDTIIKSVEIIKYSTDSVQPIKTIITYGLAGPNSTVLDYIQVLIWPSLLVAFVIIFFKQIKMLIEKVIDQSEELEFMGLRAKVSQQIKEIETEKDPEKIKEKVRTIQHQDIMEEFKLLSSYFFTKTFQVRKKTAVQISKLTTEMTIEELLIYASSSLPGERVAAYIGIKKHLELFKTLENDERIIEALSQGLDDAFSRVRYRVVQAISVSTNLIAIFKDNLKSLFDDESNIPVKEEIDSILKT